jgi:hypothetical protein
MLEQMTIQVHGCWKAMWVAFLPRVQGPKCGVQFACRTNSLGFSMATSLAAIYSKCDGGGLLTELYLSKYLSATKDDPRTEPNFHYNSRGAHQSEQLELECDSS